MEFLEDGSNAKAIIEKLVELLRHLLQNDEAASLDLSGFPLTSRDYEILNDMLGSGEVSAEIADDALISVRETGIPGVWWVTHYNNDGELISEFIEVAYCPEALITAADDVKEGMESLKARLFESKYFRS